MHARDTARLVRLLRQLRDAGNTVVVVEHEASVMRAADQIIELGPGHGEAGGEVVFQGTCQDILRAPGSLTGAYLAGRKQIEPPPRRPVAPGGEEETDEEEPGEAGCGPIAIEGWESLGGVVAVDQSPLGRTPRSNPAVYIGAFEDIRAFFAQDEAARQRGLSASAFSFNSAQGQCERCRGAGFEKIEMQFLSDVFVRCPDCNGRRYRPHILEVTVAGRTKSGAARNWSIADVLEASVDEAIDFFGGFPSSRPAMRAVESLGLLQETGLGYLRVGQPVNTLSGGESQRLKLVNHLAQARGGGAPGARPVLFVFDEPTTGLHFEDARM